MNTMQQEFDAVVEHLYKQDRPAITDDGECVYRGDDGLMCAVGCRIPDSMYDYKMEGTAAHDLARDFYVTDEIAAYAEMFNDLQWAHDSWPHEGGFHDIEESLKQVADKHNLTYTSPYNKS